MANYQIDSTTTPSVVVRDEYEARTQAAKARLEERVNDGSMPPKIAEDMRQMIERDEWAEENEPPTTPCPHWCTVSQKYPRHDLQYDGLGPNGFIRTHSVDFGDRVTLDVDEYNDCETVTYNGMHISVWTEAARGGPDALDLAGAKSLAENLALATAKLEELQQS